MASLAPDVDGLGLLFGPEAYGRYHHRLTHNVLFGVLSDPMRGVDPAARGR